VTFDELQTRFRTARPLVIMRMKSAPMMLAFFHKVFRSGHITTLTNSELRTKLEIYLEDIGYEQVDDELDAITLFDDQAQKAAQYIEKWSSAGFLRKYPDDTGEDLHELTPDSLKVLNWLDDLEKREFIGTNSRFRDIFSRLREMIEQSNEDPQGRIEELQKKKAELENEIELIRLGKTPVVFSDTDIKERFYEISRTAKELLSDFSEVEQNFQQIRKDLQIKYSEKDVVKGDLLLYALDALDEIYEKDQGKSFKSFWDFLSDEKKQNEFGELTEQLYALLKSRSIEYNNDRFLKNLKRHLHNYGKKVVDANVRLSEKLSRVLSEKNLLDRKRASELIRAIRQNAFTLAEQDIRNDHFIALEDEPLLHLTDRYMLTFGKDTVRLPQFPEDAIEETPDLHALFDQFSIDRKKLQANIDALLQDNETVSLKEVVHTYGMPNGLSDIVGYFSIACSGNLHMIMDVLDPIICGNKKVNVPLVLYVKQKENAS
jgi:hypothetical protein